MQGNFAAGVALLLVGKSRLAAGAVVCRASNGFPLANGFRALPVTELRWICLGVTHHVTCPGWRNNKPRSKGQCQGSWTANAAREARP